MRALMHGHVEQLQLHTDTERALAKLAPAATGSCALNVTLSNEFNHMLLVGEDSHELPGKVRHRVHLS